MKFKNPKIKKLYDYLSLKSKKAYRDHLLISNPVLSKQETRGRVFETYLADKTPLPTSFYLIAKKIIVYLVKNLISFVLCIIAALFHLISGQKFHVKDGVDYVLLDTFFKIDHIINEGSWITLNGSKGLIYKNRLPLIKPILKNILAANQLLTIHIDK